MTMDKSAIEQIQKAQSIETAAQCSISAIEQIGVGETPFVALPEDMRLHNLEEYLPGRVRFRGTMNTSIIDDFSQYVKRNKFDDGVVCFINPEQMSAKAFFNLGSTSEPGHGDFTSKLSLEKTSEYTELLRTDGSVLDQRSMAEWFEDWKDYIQFFGPDGEAIDSKTAIAATRRMTIESARKVDHEASDFRTSRSAMESIEARSEHGMAHGFRFTCQPYNGLEEHSFDCRIAIRTSGDAPAFRIQVRQLELEQERISEEFMGILNGKFEEENVSIYRGSFSV